MTSASVAPVSGSSTFAATTTAPVASVLVAAGWLPGQSSNYGLYWVASDGGPTHAIIPPYQPEPVPAPYAAAVSPAGDRVVYVNQLITGSPEDLRIANMDGSGARILFTPRSGEGLGSASWSPDGTTVMFSKWDAVAGWVIATVNTVGAPLVRVPAQWASYRRGEYNPTDASEIITADPQTSAIVLVRNGVVSTVPGTFGEWATMAPDGTRIAFVDTSGALAVVNRDGSGRVRLAAPLAADGGGSRTYRWLSWSVDGRTVYFDEPAYEAAPTLWSVPADGSAKPTSISFVTTWWGDGIRLTSALRDFARPAPISSLRMRIASGHPVLRWLNSPSVDFSHVVIARTSGATTKVVYSGRRAGFTDTGLTVTSRVPRVVYSVSAVDGMGNRSAPVTTRLEACFGQVPTLIGSNAADALIGTTHRDVIVGLAGNDYIGARSGNDLVCSGSGNDKVLGGYGNDVISGGYGNDEVLGSYGDDRLFGGSGDDRIFGGPGRDVIGGGPGIDVCRSASLPLARDCEK
jgi:Ca2+-binding RTX toxin-like protein